MCLVVLFKHGQDPFLRQAPKRPAADANDGALANACLGQGLAHLVGQCAALGQHSNPALQQHPVGMDAQLAFAWRDHSRCVWPNDDGPFASRIIDDGQHILVWHSLGGEHQQGNAGSDDLQGAIHGKAGRHKAKGGIDLVLGRRLGNRIIDRDAVDLLPPLARRDARHNLCAILLHDAGLERSHRTGDALDQNARIACL